MSYQVTLKIKKISHDRWHEGEVRSDIWLNSAGFTLSPDFLLFAHLCGVSLLQHCIPIDWQADTARWCNDEMNLAGWCQQLVASKAMVPLIHHWLIIQGQRSMYDLRMNTLGWSGFKSAWFTPPGP